MSRGERRVVGTEDVVGGPRVVGSWSFATEVAMGGRGSDQGGSLWVVALVVLTARVADGLTLALAGWAPHRLGGESPAGEARTADWHHTNFSCSPMGRTPLIEQLQSQHDATVFAYEWSPPSANGTRWSRVSDLGCGADLVRSIL